MKKFNLLLLCILVLCGLFVPIKAQRKPQSATVEQQRTEDFAIGLAESLYEVHDLKQTDAHYSAIEFMLSIGYVPVYPNGNFQPDSPLLRGDFVNQLNFSLNGFYKVVSNARPEIAEKVIIKGFSANRIPVSSRENFKDVSPIHPIYEPLRNLTEKHSVDISEQGNFGLSKPVTEKELYAWLKGIFGVEAKYVSAASTDTVTRGVGIMALSAAFNDYYKKFDQPKYVEQKLIKSVTPVTPPEAKKKGLHDRIEVLVTVDESGDVISAQALNGNKIFHASAEAAARASKFKPATVNNFPVKTTGKMIFSF